MQSSNLTNIKETMEKNEEECLKQIASLFDEYTNYRALVKHLPKEALRELKYAIEDIEFDQNDSHNG